MGAAHRTAEFNADALAPVPMRQLSWLTRAPALKTHAELAPQCASSLLGAAFTMNGVRNRNETRALRHLNRR
jgi:hypothetical protein